MLESTPDFCLKNAISFIFNSIYLNMTFEKTLKDIDCNCLDDCYEDYKNNYARYLGKNITNITEESFKSYFEHNKKPKNDSCPERCSNRAVSFSLINEVNFDAIMNNFEKYFGYSPQFKKYVVIIKFLENAGLLKQYGTNIDHYDFYKSDEFEIDHLEIIEQIDLNEYVRNR